MAGDATLLAGRASTSLGRDCLEEAQGGRGSRFGRRGSSWAFAALCALAASLPLELPDPLVSLRLVGVTNVEVLLYLAVGLWLLGRPRPQPLSARWAAGAFALALVLSAMAASEHRAAAAKFALRQIGGVLLFFATADLVATRRGSVVLATAYAGGAAVSSVAALAETSWPAAAEALLRFKTGPSMVDGALRASGTLQYANLAAMSWGMALPVTLALGAACRGTLPRVAAGVGALVLAEALVLSASRAGLLTAMLVLGAMTATARGPLLRLRRPALLALLAVVCLAGLDLAAGGGLALRLREREDRPWFEAQVRAEAVPSLEAGGFAAIPLRVRNAGRLPWRASGEHAISLGYVWATDAGGKPRRAGPLPRDVEPGDTVTLEARVLAPGLPGRHRLRWLLTGSGLAWVGSESGATELEVEVGPASGTRAPGPQASGLPRLLFQAQPTRPALWRAGLALWAERPLLGVGPDNFRRLYARKLGPHVLDERVHANSLYVEVLATLGLLGAAALAALGAALAVTGARALASAEPAPRLVAAGALAGLLAFFVHGLVDYGLEASAVYGAFWLLGGLVAGIATAPTAADGS